VQPAPAHRGGARRRRALRGSSGVRPGIAHAPSGCGPMRRIVDRGAIVAAYVGIGMAVTMAIGFLLVIPIQPIYVLLSIPGGMVIGYYANARSGRQRGAWRRILPNALLGGVVTGLTLASLLLGTRALFFFADSGYPDFNRTDA